MQLEKQQQILGYFIEEAKEHLETLEQGLVDLKATMADPERVNELFRAAHSVKGGAAMLGFNSIHKAAHRLEDCFKLLQENPVQVDQQLETLFLGGFDTLRELTEYLQGPFGLREEDAEQVLQQAEPTFTQLQDYLNRLIGVGSKTLVGVGAQATGATDGLKSAPKPNHGAENFAAQVTAILKQMLVLFKQKETPASRQQLQALCDRLLPLGNQLEGWQLLVRTAQAAIKNPYNSYAILAPIVIKELKQSGDLLQTGSSRQITISPQLKVLVTRQEAARPAPPPMPDPIRYAPAPSPEPISTAAFLEPRLAAKALIQAFNKQQLCEIVELLQKATR